MRNNHFNNENRKKTNNNKKMKLAPLKKKTNNYNNNTNYGDNYIKAEEENRKLKIELNQKNNELLHYNSRIEILKDELHQLKTQKNAQKKVQNNNNHLRGKSNNYNTRVQYNNFYDPFDDILSNGGLNNILFDSPFDILPNRNMQRINPNFNPGDYEDYYEDKNINNLIPVPHNNFVNNFVNINDNDESKIEQDIIDQLYPDPDKMTYEQLLELEENVGSVSKGLTKNQIKKIPKVIYNKYRFSDEDNKCVVCQYEFKNGEEVTQLPCGHLFHSDCVDTWLSKNKVCPMCHKEIKIK